MERAIFSPSIKVPYKDEPLERLLSEINKSRAETKFSPYSFSRLNLDLKKIGKSHKNWDRNIWIASVLDATNPAKTYFWRLKELKK